MNYVLYGEPNSGSFSTEAALREADAEFDILDFDLKKGEHLSPSYRAVNPTGKIPALKLPSGEIITETIAILLTIAERHPGANLLPPPASVQRASALRWIAFLGAEVYPMVEIVDYPERFMTDQKGAAELRERARERIRQRLLILERGIEGDPWIGREFSAADIYAAIVTRWFVGAEWRAANTPKIERLAKAVSERPKIAPVWRRHFGAAGALD
jgi:GST-like protein